MKSIIQDGAHRASAIPALRSSTALSRIIYQNAKDKPVMPLPGQTVVRIIE